MRHFVVIGQLASATPDFRLDDLPGTSGRLDILVRCLRAGILVSHGLRRDAVMYLVLRHGSRVTSLPPEVEGADGTTRAAIAAIAVGSVMRMRGADARFVRPDERALAVLVKKCLEAWAVGSRRTTFTEVKPGIAIADGDIEVVLDDLGARPLVLLDEGGTDIREPSIMLDDAAFFLGDHRGFDPRTRAELLARGARPVAVGPVSIHAEDAIAIVSNELDRREALAIG